MAEVKGGRSLGQQIQVLGSPVISLCPEVFNDLGTAPCLCREGGEGGITKEQKRLLGLQNMFSILIVVKAS